MCVCGVTRPRSPFAARSLQLCRDRIAPLPHRRQRSVDELLVLLLLLIHKESVAARLSRELPICVIPWLCADRDRRVPTLADACHTPAAASPPHPALSRGATAGGARPCSLRAVVPLPRRRRRRVHAARPSSPSPLQLASSSPAVFLSPLRSPHASHHRALGAAFLPAARTTAYRSLTLSLAPPPLRPFVIVAPLLAGARAVARSLAPYCWLGQSREMWPSWLHL